MKHNDVSVNTRTVAAAVPRAAHGVPMAALLPAAAGEASRRSLLRAVAVAAHTALFVIAARIHLLGQTHQTKSQQFT